MEEFRQRLIDRHGSDFPADRCIRNIQHQLEKCSGLSMADFLAYDAERTTAPRVLHNPAGHYVTLAKELRTSAVAALHASAFAPLRRAAEAAPPEPERDQHGRCTACRGSGRPPDRAYCTCALGRDLEKLERRKSQPQQVTKKSPACAGRKGTTNVSTN